LDAVDDWHIDIDDDDIRLLFRGEVYGFTPIAGFSADIEVAAGAEQGTQTDSDVGVIVGEKDFDHHFPGPCRPQIGFGYRIVFTYADNTSNAHMVPLCSAALNNVEYRT